MVRAEGALRRRPAREGLQRQVAADEEDEEDGVDQDAKPERRNRETLFRVDRHPKGQGEEDRYRCDGQGVQPDRERQVPVDEGVKSSARSAPRTVEPGRRVERADRGKARRPRVDEDENDKDEKKGAEGEERLLASPPEPPQEFLPDHATS